MKNRVIAGFLLCGMTAAFLFAGQNGKAIVDKIDELSKKFRQWNDILPEDRVYVQCDKPFYSPGETIWFSAFARDAFSLKASAKSDIIYVELLNPKGSVEKSLALIAKNGIAKGDISLSDDIAGGIYKIKAYTNWQKNDPDPAFFIKDIQIQDVVLPRLKMKLDFAKKAYGSGDKVQADLAISTNENKPLAESPVTFTVAIAGVQILSKELKSDISGKVKIAFDLPAALTSTDGLLNVLIDYDGQMESISRAIPIVLNKIALTFYPEGGDPVAGLESKIAFRAKNEFDKGADIEGFVVDDSKNKVTDFSSFHMGMGAFTFTPAEGKQYTAYITRPAGIKESYPIPEPMQQGYVLSVNEVTNSTLKISIGSTRDEKLRIFMQVRGNEYFSKVIDAKKGMNRQSIDLKGVPIGVAQITLFDSKDIERAERLVFVNKHRQLTVSVKSDKERYLPREKVKLTVTASDETGMRMPGNFSLSVSDDQLLSFADDKSSTILSHILTESDLKGKVDEPRFYFDPKEKKADKALDYLLLTQGWRRFTWKQITENELPSINYQSEKAVIAGVVMDYQTSKPVKDAIVKIIESKVETRTDSSGAFTFKNIDLSEPKTITAKKGQLETSTTVSQFTSSLQLWLNEYRHFVRPMAAGGAMQDDAIMENAAVAQPPAPARAAVKNKEELLLKIQELEKTKKNLNGRAAVKMALKPDAAKNAGAPRMRAAKIPAAMRKEAAEKKLMKRQFANAPEPIMAQEKIAMEEQRPDMFDKDEEAAAQEVVSYYRARVYAVPDYSDKKPPIERTDFRSTIYWNGDIELGKNGSGSVEFYTSDAITSFRIITEGFSVDGGIGRAEQVFFTQVPFSISAKIPSSVLTGDTLLLSLLIKNTTPLPIDGRLTLSIPSGMKLAGSFDSKTVLAANSSKTIPVKIAVESINDSAMFGASFEGQGVVDGFSLPVKIISQGFPVDESFSGNELQGKFSVKVTNPVKNSMKASLRAYPSITSDLLAGVESILQEPYGCFEQTSMTSYPNALVLSYLKATGNKDSALRDKAEGLLDRGYKRLVTFETKDKGYEWFGSTPGHEALTAYGLMQFSDISKTSPIVDKAMIDRTSAWLMSRRDNLGGFQRNPQALDSYGGADQDITNAYIVYALSEAGRRDLQKELDESVKKAKESSDPYMLALMANALFCYEDNKRGDELLKVLIGKQTDDGSWCGTRHSITRSEGISLKLETTSLTCLAIMRSIAPDAAALTKGIKFIVASRSGAGGFGATQSTVLSLKALTAYSQFARKTDAPGTIIIAVNGKDVAKKSYAAGEKDAIIIDSLEQFLKDGETEVTIRFADTKTALPYTLAVSYYTWQPESSKECKAALETSIASNSVKVGQTVRVSAILSNTTENGQPMTLAVIGLPAGLSAQPWQLKELQEKKVFDFYEITGSTVVFYYRQLKPGEKRTINLDCKAEIPGFYTAPASRAYLYYTNEHKTWTSLKPLKIEM